MNVRVPFPGCLEVHGPFTARCGEEVSTYEQLVIHQRYCGKCFFDKPKDAVRSGREWLTQ